MFAWLVALVALMWMAAGMGVLRAAARGGRQPTLRGLLSTNRADALVAVVALPLLGLCAVLRPCVVGGRAVVATVWRGLVALAHGDP